MRKLYYSLGSPFARKVRIVLAEKGLEYEKDELNNQLRPIAEFSSVNPNLQVPVLEDGELQLFDSNLIVDYLLKTYPEAPAGTPEPPLATTMTRPDRHWEDAKILATLETMANSIVNLRLMMGEGVKVEDVIYLQRQQSRVQLCLDWLEQRAEKEGFAPGWFSIMDINLICPLQFSDARGGFIEWRGRPKLEAISANYQQRPSIQTTAPNPAPVAL